MNNQILNETDRLLGNTAGITFVQLGGKTIIGKVDTGATTSSLHASNIEVNERRRSVSFKCEPLSPNVLTLPLEGSQEVHSADAGGVTRPVVKVDIEINGVPMEGVTFNLNDRSGMDTIALIGQNVLKAGNFQIDPNQEAPKPDSIIESLEPDQVALAISEAIDILIENDVSFTEIVEYIMHAAASTQ